MPIDDQLAIIGRLALAAAALGAVISCEAIAHEDPNQEGTDNDR